MWRLLLGTMGVRALSKDSTQRPRPDSNRGPFDPKSDAVTDWPLRLLLKSWPWWNSNRVPLDQKSPELSTKPRGCFFRVVRWWKSEVLNSTRQYVVYGSSPTTWFRLIMNISGGSCDFAWWRGDATDVTNDHTCHFYAVCLTVFPFDFWPRTFTVGFYKKSIR